MGRLDRKIESAMKSKPSQLKDILSVLLLFLGYAFLCPYVTAQEPSSPGTAFDGSIMLGSPASTSIKTSVFSPDQNGAVYIEYGVAPGAYSTQTATGVLQAAIPLVLILDGLNADAQYYYRLNFQATGESGFSPTGEYTFHSARPTGSTFTFTIQADSHLDENSDLDLYRRTLANVLADAPDFHIDLGDTFMCEKHSAPLTAVVQMAPDQATVNARYVYERANFGIVAFSAPLLLVNGNHEGEAGWLNDGTASNLAIWTTLARQHYYLNPVPDAFYAGDLTEEPFVGKRASWYAWHWGSALFVVLDPYWNSMSQPGNDGWSLTLGERQYTWLQETLSSSSAIFKFVFIHNLVGGLDGQMRGGIEAAPYFEWGGQNLDGTVAFSQKRPGWSMPIHQLLVQHGVTAVFHGHDHLYARQELGGVVYQEVPQPSANNFQSGPGLAAKYHYAAGTILSSSGHLRVNVSPDRTTAQYVRAWLPANENAQRQNRQVDDTWICEASASPAVSFDGNIVLGCPTATSIRANVYSPDQSGTVYLAYGTAPGAYTLQTVASVLQAAMPLEIALDGLNPDMQYYYRLYLQATGETTYSRTDEYAFRTARSVGSTFTFCIQGDSHPERVNNQFNAALYTRTLQTATADNPDFYVTMGDDFSVDQLDATTVTAVQVIERYTIQRPYLGLIGCTSPIFLVNGNHEQAARYLLDGTPDNVAVWAQNARNTLYSQPAPDNFYSGNTEVIPYIGLLRNYFAWTWGDALFVTIDPYWASLVCVDNPFGGGPKRPNVWDVTHGNAQYQWLKTTLEQSQAKYKFVFAHHVLGTGRGGIEEAPQYEWGGENADGTWGFTTNRSTWPETLHQLMVNNHVTIFFQGHDHIWVHQALDGVTYQTLSEPADPNYSLFNADAYLSGDKFPNTGYTRVTVSSCGVKVDYVRTYLPADEGPGKVSGATVFTYSIDDPGCGEGEGEGEVLAVDFAANPGWTKPGVPVQFNGIVTGTQQILDWRWELGDGSIVEGEEPNPTHTYATEGTYSVTLTVTTATNSATVTKQNVILVSQSLSVGRKVTSGIIGLVFIGLGTVLLSLPWRRGGVTAP